jgi:uncharacterized protein (DUF2147 family)
MRLVALIFSILIFAKASSLAAEAPIGEWLAPEENSNGHGRVRIEDCGGTLWGVVSGELKSRQDSENPEPALRGRPTLGMPILLDMKEKESTRWGETTTRWEGQFYNSRNGMTYESNIRLLSPNSMKLETCEPGGVFCGSQKWDRARAPSASTTSQGGGAPKPPIANWSAPKAPVANSVIAAGDVCSRVIKVPDRAQ